MQKDIRIILRKSTCSENEGFLDVNKIAGFGLNYAIDDVKKIESKNSSYSKTILLPGTKNNNIELGNLFDINSTFTFFNPNKKSNAFILVNDSVVMKGYFQLKNIKKIKNSDLSGNIIQYEIVFFDDTVDIFNKIGERKLNEIDLQTYNHKWDFESITSTWGIKNITRVSSGNPTENFGDGPVNNFYGQQTYSDANTWRNCYVYPTYFKGNLTDNNLINDGEKNYETKDFYPAIFSKFYLYRICADAGIDIGGDFFENDKRFEKEIIPYNGDIPLYDEAVENNNWAFQSGLYSPVTDLIKYNLQGGLGGNNEYFSFLPFTEYTLQPSGDHWFDSLIPVTNDTIQPFFDNAEFGGSVGNWDVNNYGYTPIEEGTFDVYANIVIKVELFFSANNDNTIDAEIFNTSVAQNPITLTLGSKAYDKLTETTLPGTQIQHQINIDIPNNIYNGYDSQILTIRGKLLEDFHLTNLDLFRPTLKMNGTDPHYVTYDYTAGPQPYYVIDGTYKITILDEHPDDNNNKTKIYNVLKSGKLKDGSIATINEGNTLKLSSFIPKNIKQLDFFNDIIRRYNLYVTNDSQNPNKILLTTRDKFYSDGALNKLDWSNKIDNDQEQKITLLQELQNKRVTFTYKEGKDDYSKAYKASTSDIYGVKKIEFDNFFSRGDKKIQSIFASTPDLYDTLINPTKIVPSINTTQPKNLPRVLLFEGMKDTLNDRSWVYEFNDSRDDIYSHIIIKKYPYCGMINDPINPTIDVAYNKVPYVFYNDLEGMTDNNLYNSYWRNYMNQIAKGKLLTGKFDLNETDIHFIKDNLGTQIFIIDSWYVINKIIDFNPTNNNLTTVELLKMSDPTPFVVTNYRQQALDPADPITNEGGTPTLFFDTILFDFDNFGLADVGNDTGVIRDECNIITNIIPSGNPTPIGDPVTNENLMINLIDGGNNELRSITAEYNLNLIDGGNNELLNLFPSNNWGVIKTWDGSAEYSTWMEAIGLVNIP